MKRTIGNKLNDYKHLKPPGSEFLPRLVMIRRAVKENKCTKNMSKRHQETVGCLRAYRQREMCLWHL